MENPQRLTLADWLDDLCVRFVMNNPGEELELVERICFQIEEAHWYYEDFVREVDPSLRSMSLREFSDQIFKHCPLLHNFNEEHRTAAFDEFLAYKVRVPVRGAILLDEEMENVVLVKGWKKNANWSFPRGKILKDEDDLDCAIREVYEETGYDIKAAGLIRPDEKPFAIHMDMREQNMMLYAFRGVPRDTSFVPRTRKEISKVEWFAISELPTAKRNKQQGNGGKAVRDNKYYMVAPFMKPLKAWIASQKSLDKQRSLSEQYSSVPVPPQVQEIESSEQNVTPAHPGKLDANLADHQTNLSFHNLIANLGRQRTSDSLPEVSLQSNSIADPASELKRLLSVNAVQPSTATAPGPVEAPAPVPDHARGSNKLLAMLRGNGTAAPSPPPRTPFEQLISPPDLPLSPHYQHARPSHLDSMPPPPAFPIYHQQSPNPRGAQHAPFPLSNQNGSRIPGPHQMMPPTQATHRGPPFHLVGGPGLQQAFNQYAPRPYQRTGDPQFARPSAFPASGPRVPSASQLPKLSAHSLALLNTFKNTEKDAPAPVKVPDVSNVPVDSVSSPPSGAEQYIAPPPPAPFGVPSPITQQAAPKPRNAHQNNLLDLFRSPSVTNATPPPITHTNPAPEPVELSAQPTPAGPRHDAVAAELAPLHPDRSLKPSLLDPITAKPSLTSATVSGPLNAPDFETVQKQAKLGDVNGDENDLGSSPNLVTGKGKKSFVPSQVLVKPKRALQQSPAPIEPKRKGKAPASPKTIVPAAYPVNFRPQILKRPQQPTTAAPIPVAPTSAPITAPELVPSPRQKAPPLPFDRRESLPLDQKNTLLSLFSKQTQASKPPGSPTPKQSLSNIISPVSPLAANASQQGSPANLASRSRISSIGEGLASPPLLSATNIVAGQQSAKLEEGNTSTTGAAKLEKVESATGRTPVTPVDKQFLLGFLEKVAGGKK